MNARLRIPKQGDLSALSALCLRSKAYWGYDAAFMAACVDELTLTSADLEAGGLIAMDADGEVVGLAQITRSGPDADLAKLFVDPGYMRRGAGRVLLNWACDTARTMGSRRLLIEADPGAASFYERCGATRIGQVPSGSIPGRVLPHLAIEFDRLGTKTGLPRG